MTASKDPLHQLLDLMFYAPIGLITIARRELPQLVAEGRTRVDGQLKVARLVGKLAVSKGKRELDRRLDEIERSRRPAELVAALAEPAAAPLTIVEAVAAELDERPAPADVTSSEEALPIEGYDSLAASQVVLRLGSLTGSELDALRNYESTHRNRRTVLGKISQLQAR